MSTGCKAILTGMVVAVMCLTAAAAAQRPAQWRYFHFDGHAFVAGRPADGTTAVALAAGVRPVLVKGREQPEAVNLAGGTGALVGICYTQRSGGKLQAGPSFLPGARMAVRIYSGDRLVAAAETDDQGYFLVTVAAGRYRVEAREVAQVTVENGTTTLVPLRVGKRMVD